MSQEERYQVYMEPSPYQDRMVVCHLDRGLGWVADFLHRLINAPWAQISDEGDE